jgi:hypothetical protein
VRGRQANKMPNGCLAGLSYRRSVTAGSSQPAIRG